MPRSKKKKGPNEKNNAGCDVGNISKTNPPNFKTEKTQHSKTNHPKAMQNDGSVTGNATKVNPLNPKMEEIQLFQNNILSPKEIGSLTCDKLKVNSPKVKIGEIHQSKKNPSELKKKNGSSTVNMSEGNLLKKKIQEIHQSRSNPLRDSLGTQQLSNSPEYASCKSKNKGSEPQKTGTNSKSTKVSDKLDVLDQSFNSKNKNVMKHANDGKLPYKNLMESVMESDAVNIRKNQFQCQVPELMKVDVEELNLKMRKSNQAALEKMSIKNKKANRASKKCTDAEKTGKQDLPKQQYAKEIIDEFPSLNDNVPNCKPRKQKVTKGSRELGKLNVENSIQGDNKYENLTEQCPSRMGNHPDITGTMVHGTVNSLSEQMTAVLNVSPQKSRPLSKAVSSIGSSKENVWNMNGTVKPGTSCAVKENIEALDQFLNLSIQNVAHEHEKTDSNTTQGKIISGDMFTTHDELSDFKEKILAILNRKGKDKSMTVNETCHKFRSIYGCHIRDWFKHCKKGKMVPPPLRLFMDYLHDVVLITINSNENDAVITARTGRSQDSASFQAHLKTMSAEQCEKQLLASMEHVQGSSKDIAISIDDDDVVEVGKVDVSNKELSDIHEEVENFKLYRDFQLIHINYIKLRIVTMYHNHGEKVITLSYFMQLFKLMFCENFFSKSILECFVTQSSYHSEDFVISFIKRFCTEFLSITDDLSVEITQQISSIHVKFLNQLINTLEKLAETGGVVRAVDPTPAEMMMLGKAGEAGSGINTASIRSQNGKYVNTFITFPGANNLHSLTGSQRPTLSEVNERVHQIRNRICREGHCIKLTEIIQELCSFYKVASIRDLRPTESREIRREGDIPALHEIIFLQGKVNAFIQAFVEFRNVCTVHELEEELCKMENKTSFSEFKLGPLQKHLLVYEFFKFPPFKDIPAITTLEVFRLLWKCQSEMYHSRGKSGGDRDRLTLHQFMEFFIKHHGFSDPFESGVRINSIGLAISVVRKAWFGDLHNTRESVKRFTKQLCDEFDQHLKHSVKSIVGKHKGLPGEPENFLQRIAGMNILDGFSHMYAMLQKMKQEACKTLPGTAHFVNFSDITMNALSVIQKDELMSRIFHVLLSTAPLKALGKDDVSILEHLGFKAVIEVMINEGVESNKTAKKEKVKKTDAVSKALLTNTIMKWLLKNADLSMEVLSNIEGQITSEIGNYDSFDDLGHGSFLKFINAEKKLRDTVEGAFGTSGSSSCKQIVSKKEINNFVYQCGDGHKSEEIKKACSYQFNIHENDSFLLMQMENMHGIAHEMDAIIMYEHAFLCGSDIHKNIAQSDRLYFAESAMKRIYTAPYLICLSKWTNWELMFQPKLGPLKDFLGTFPKMDVNFFFMETSRNRYVKVIKHCPLEQFLHCLKVFDAPMTAACILSIIVSSCHISNAPIALLSNHVQNALLEAARKGNSDGDEEPDYILAFCLDCFTLLPFNILCSVVRKLFLSPLSKVYGALKVPSLLLSACSSYSDQKNVLHLLGFHLDIEEWMKDYEEELNALSVHKAPPVVIDKPERTADEKVDADCIIISKANEVISTSVPAQPILIPDEDGDEVNKLTRTKKVVIEVDDSPVVVVEDVLTDESLNETDFSVEDVSTEDIVSKVIENLINKVTNTENPDGNKDLQEPFEEIILDPFTKRLRYCQSYINTIRREQFGVGLEFGVEEGKLIEILRERQGRSLYRLSQELYTKDSHFVLELIQNADDNEYPSEFFMGDAIEKPTVAFIVEEDKITILNNEKGFVEDNVKALCDVGKSTKGIHRKGYIGQKGIGFKSVFRVTDSPEIHSNGFHITFDAKSGPNGYICPQWVDEWQDQEKITYQPSTEKQYSWTTQIILPLKKEMQHSKLTSRFHDIHSSLLMFLNRLHTIIIDDKVTGSVNVMTKDTKDGNMVHLSQNNSSSIWFVASKEINIDLLQDVKITDISVAFPIELETDNQSRSEILPSQPVFAYLPLRSYGFKFIIQADFEVPSSREDIDKDSSWNQCILHHIPQLVVDAFHKFKCHPHFPKLSGIIEYFKYMDLEDHVLGVFKQVGRNIIKSLQRESCLPADQGEIDEEGYQWVIPSSVVMSQSHNKDIIHPQMLHENLGLYYVHKDIQMKIPEKILQVLGVSRFSLDQLIEICKCLTRKFSDPEILRCDDEIRGIHAWIGQWMHLIYQTLQENCDCSQKTLAAIKSLKVFPLCDGSLVSLSDAVVFFPVDVQNRHQVSKEVEVIENDLSILSRALLSKIDQIQIQQVMRLLKDLGIKSMTPYDLIHNHIIPIFKTVKWKDKSEDLLVAFVSYLHKQLINDPELCDIRDLRESVALLTNKGFFLPANEVIYFTPEYGNRLNLKKKFPACDWHLISNRYLSNDFSAVRKKQWEDFFCSLGVQYFSLLRKKKEVLHKSDLCGTVWEKSSKSWPKTADDTYVINDLVCPEFYVLLASKKTDQIISFALELDSRWASDFAKYKLADRTCIVENTSGERIEKTFSSFSLKMANSAWIPSSNENEELFVPCELYRPLPAIHDIFATKVDYLTSAFKSEDFIQTLGVLSSVTFDKFISAFSKWRDSNSFRSSHQHTVNIYRYMQGQARTHPNEIRDLLVSNFIFLPSTRYKHQLTDASSVDGRFLKVKQVCWEDPSNIIASSNDMNQRRMLKGYYPKDLREFFVSTIGVDRYPSTKEYLNLVHSIASKTTLPDKDACFRICTLFSVIGETCIKESMRAEVEREWYLPEAFNDRRILYTDLESAVDAAVKLRLQSDDVREEKIFPTSANQFASLSQKPLLALNDDLAFVFKKEENVPIIFIDTIAKMLKTDSTGNARHHRRGESEEQVKKMMRILTLFRACEIQLLSDVYIPPEVITIGMSRGCPKWEQIIHDITPYLQRFMAARLNEIYLKSQTNDFAAYLKKSTIFTVQSLEVIYRLRDRNDVNVKRTKIANVEDCDGKRAMIYITEKFVDDKNQHENILNELMEIFVGKLEQYKEILLDFATAPNKDSYLDRKKIPRLPSSHVIWEYPEPEKILPPPKPAPIHVLPQQPMKRNDGEAGLRCWPPRQPGGSGMEPKPDSVREEEVEILKKWKQPEAAAGMVITASSVEKNDSLVEANAVSSKSKNSQPPSIRSGSSGADNIKNNSSHPGTDSNLSNQSPESTLPSKSTSLVESASEIAVSSASDTSHTMGVSKSDTLFKSDQEEGQQKETNDENIASSSEGKGKRKRVPSSMEVDGNATASSESSSSVTSPPKQKKPFTRRKQDSSQDYSAPTSKNLTTNRINLDIAGHSGLELDEEYEDLNLEIGDEPEEGEITLPTFDAADEENNMETARYGEEVVFKHLCKVYSKEISAGEVKIDWLNSDGESKSPYDLKIIFAESNLSLPIYIEVKSTILDERKQFFISSQQLKFAFSEGACFHLYRVSGLAKDSKLQIKRLRNLSSYMDRKAVKLYMLL